MSTVIRPKRELAPNAGKTEESYFGPTMDAVFRTEDGLKFPLKTWVQPLRKQALNKMREYWKVNK